jgi:phosphatidylglycerophosphate synthase
MRIVHLGPLTGLLGQLALLLLLAGTVGLTGTGWLVGAAWAGAATALLSQGLERAGSDSLGAANRVTLTRTVLVGGVAALVADAFVRPAAVVPMVLLAAVALVLDGVDGWVARRTGTASTLGARFDMEVDAFLILVLSLHVAREVGLGVLVIGAARYLFVAAAWLLPWMRATLPARYWRKPVAATQGVVLTLVATDLLPPLASLAAIVVALALLAESFGRDVWWLRRQHRSLAPEPAVIQAEPGQALSAPAGSP